MTVLGCLVPGLAEPAAATAVRRRSGITTLLVTANSADPPDAVLVPTVTSTAASRSAARSIAAQVPGRWPGW